MGSSFSTFSTSIGGISKVFPVGTFVRVPRQLTKEEIHAAAVDSNSRDWDTEMDVSVGQIGIVLGGDDRPTMNTCSVGFMLPNGSTLGKWWNFEDAWLEPVAESDVDEKLRASLRKFMLSELHRMLRDTVEKQSFNVSVFGPPGTLVQVCFTKPDAEGWTFPMDRTLNQIGIVLGGSAGQTCVILPEPLFTRYFYKDAWLRLCHTQSLDDLTCFPKQYTSLCEIRKIILHVTREREKKILSWDSDYEDDSPRETRPLIVQQVESLELRVAALENARSQEQIIRVPGDDNV